MTEATVRNMSGRPGSDEAPPPGTAIVRPLAHVRAVREHQAAEPDPSGEAGPRGARTWAWALGETPTAPVTGRQTQAPPAIGDIESEIAASRAEGQADIAATILGWLIGADDHLPIRDQNRGDLVGGTAGVIRSASQTTDLADLAHEAQLQAAERSRDLDADADSRLSGQQDADYLAGVIATLAWATGQRSETPVSQRQCADLSTRTLKTERLRARDVIDQAASPWVADRLPPGSYGEGVRRTIDWLLGDATAWPAD